MEAAKRAIADGQRVLFLCYNNLLGDWLKAQTSGYSDDPKTFQCRTFHSLLLEIAGEKPAKGVGDRYWRKDLPVSASDRLLDDSRAWPVYDMLIVDEAQDLLEEDYLDVLDLLLQGGLAGGKWAFFGDFERQAIYVSDGGTSALQALDGLSERAPSQVKSSLRINCRNAEPIAETLAITSGLAPGYKRVLHDSEGSDVDPLFYSSAMDQERLLATAISTLKEAFTAGEIMILSMRGDESSCAGNASAHSAGQTLAPIRNVQDGQAIPFASIHAFKGLEAPAVIITDIESLNDDRARALLYVGMSRARIRLVMLMHESCRSSYDHVLDAGLELTSKR
jgi:hypothetical protein